MAYPAPRWGGVFRLARSASGADPDQGGRALWGRASSLSVRAVEGGRAFPRECRSGLVLSPTRPWRYKGRCDVCSAGVPPAMLVYRCGLVLSPTDTDTDADTAPVPVAVVVPDRVLITGLLGRRDALASRRPSVAPSAWSRVGGGEGCDHADGAPAAFLVAGRTRMWRAPRGSPVAPLCGARGGAGWWFQHNGVPGTPMGWGFPLGPVGFGRGSRSGWAGIVGAGFQPVRQGC